MVPRGLLEKTSSSCFPGQLLSTAHTFLHFSQWCLHLSILTLLSAPVRGWGSALLHSAPHLCTLPTSLLPSFQHNRSQLDESSPFRVHRATGEQKLSPAGVDAGHSRALPCPGWGFTFLQSVESVTICLSTFPGSTMLGYCSFFCALCSHRWCAIRKSLFLVGFREGAEIKECVQFTIFSWMSVRLYHLPNQEQLRRLVLLTPKLELEDRKAF